MKPRFICQECKHHENKPSRCTFKIEGRNDRPVERKQEACAVFLPAKHKVERSCHE